MRSIHPRPHRRVSPRSTLLALLCLAVLLTSCGTPPAAEVAAQAATATPKPTAMPRRPTVTPTPRSATPTAHPPTATPVPPTVAPTDAPLPAPTPPADIPAGWVYHDVSQLGGFGFALPPSWNITRLDRDGIDALTDKLPIFPHTGQSPDQLAASGLKLIACECHQADAGRDVSALFVMSDTLPVAMSLDEAVENLIRGMEYSPMLAGPIDHARIPHPAGPTEAVQYRMRVGEQVLTATHYVLLNDRQLVFVGIVASVDRAEQQTPTYYRIMQTFRFTSAPAEPMYVQ